MFAHFTSTLYLFTFRRRKVCTNVVVCTFWGRLLHKCGCLHMCGLCTCVVFAHITAPHGSIQLAKLAKGGQLHCHNNLLDHVWHTWRKSGTNGKRMSGSLVICRMHDIIGVRGGGGVGLGGGGCTPPRIFKIAIFGAKNHVIFGQNHLIFGQAIDKIFGQLTSAPLNETCPVRVCMTCKYSN